MSGDGRVGVKEIDYAVHKTREVRGASYVYLESGAGELIVLLHGYPDNAYSWEHQIRYLSKQGYRVVAPFLRGYLPTQVPRGAYFDRASLAMDVRDLISTLNNGKPAFLVGQDWGAAIAYGVLGAFPASVRRAMIMAVPHPVEINRTLKRSPRHVMRSFHWFLFQLPVLPELIFRCTRGAFLRFLWALWSPNFKDHAHVNFIVKTMCKGTGIADSLAYYRAAIQTKYRDPRLTSVFDRLDDPIPVPTRVLCGRQDMRKEMIARQQDLFLVEADFQYALINNAGHFLHREQPDLVNKEIHAWMQKDNGK